MKPSHKTLVSSTYFPNSTTEFKLLNIEDDKRSNSFEVERWPNSDDDSILMPGLANGWKKNNNYKTLISEIGLADLDNDEIIDQFSKFIDYNKKNPCSSTLFSFRYSYWTNKVSNEIKDLIIKNWSEGWSLKTAASMFGLDETLWRLIINESKASKKQIQKIEKLEKLPYCITQQHILKANEFLKLFTNKKITLKVLQLHLRSIDGIRALSKTGVYFLLTKVLNYSYKRAHKFPK